MKNLTDIKARIKSVSDTRKITSAMETISVAKMRKATVRFENNRKYFEAVRDTIKDIVIHTNFFTNKYIVKQPKDEKAAFIVIASDKGLAGGFNHNVLNYALSQIEKYDRKKCSIFTIGQLARDFFEKRKYSVDIEFSGAAYNPSMRDAAEIASSLTTLYEKDMLDSVFIIYTKPENSAVMYPDMIRLLPLSADEVSDKGQNLSAEEEDLKHEIEYDPSPEAVMDALIPQYMSAVIYGTLIQSYCAEQCSRRAAMNNSTDSATEILEELSIDYNRARQESVTNEISEIITSAMGVNK